MKLTWITSTHSGNGGNCVQVAKTDGINGS
jgi:hypothetical protein